MTLAPPRLGIPVCRVNHCWILQHNSVVYSQQRHLTCRSKCDGCWFFCLFADAVWDVGRVYAILFPMLCWITFISTKSTTKKHKFNSNLLQFCWFYYNSFLYLCLMIQAILPDVRACAWTLYASRSRRIWIASQHVCFSRKRSILLVGWARASSISGVITNALIYAMLKLL